MAEVVPCEYKTPFHSKTEVDISNVLNVLSAAIGLVEALAGPRHPEDSLINHSEGQFFLTEAFKIIVDEVFNKGTDVQQKVFCVAFVTECLLGILNTAVFFWCRFVIGKNQRSWLSCWTWS